MVVATTVREIPRARATCVALKVEEVFLPPALEHAIGDLNRGQIATRGEDRCLVAVFRQPRDLAKPQRPLQEADTLICECRDNLAAIERDPMLAKEALPHGGETPFAVGENVEAVCDQLLEESGAVATSIEDDGQPSFANHRAHLLQDQGEHLDHPRVGLRRHNEQGVSRHVVDPIVRCGGHR